MRDEFDSYSPTYAKENVRIMGKSKLDQNQGGVLLFLHFGSFFLSGLSLIHQLGLRYTALASTRNFKAMQNDEKNLWENVHRKMNLLYSHGMFLTNKSNSREMISFLKSGGFIGAALDVAEIGQKHKFQAFDFLHNQIHLQTGPARLARIANVPIYGMSIAYDQNQKVHTLRISGPHIQNKVEESIQKLLSEMEQVVSQQMNQLFHDVFKVFSKHSVRDYMVEIKPLEKKSSKDLEPMPKITSNLPVNFAPRYESGVTSWHPHREFAYKLLSQIKPKKIVELGVHYGDSYFTFCQACEELELEAQLFGIDHWQGDEQAGFYGDEVFEEVSSYNEEFHGENSVLLRMNFEEALEQFEDGSIDLLHIDGSHEYESVKNDFENWLPKVKKGGRIMIHDILVERENFGVKKLWEETCQKYNIETHQDGFGLGIIKCL
jgi:predicted O-methyltransferase YrrM